MTLVQYWTCIGGFLLLFSRWYESIRGSQNWVATGVSVSRYTAGTGDSKTYGGAISSMHTFARNLPPYPFHFPAAGTPSTTQVSESYLSSYPSESYLLEELWDLIRLDWCMSFGIEWVFLLLFIRNERVIPKNRGTCLQSPHHMHSSTGCWHVLSSSIWLLELKHRFFQGRIIKHDSDSYFILVFTCYWRSGQALCLELKPWKYGMQSTFLSVIYLVEPPVA